MSLIKSTHDFYAAWLHESRATLKVFSNLTDESLAQKVSAEGRSLGFIAWHITQTIGEMMTRAGLTFDSFAEHAPMPASTIEIKKEYEKLSNLMLSQVKNNWSDDMLGDELDMYGQKWLRADVLLSLIVHQAHHRGQMTILMRQAGLKVPGVYGPSKEEWTSYGMEPMP